MVGLKRAFEARFQDGYLLANVAKNAPPIAMNKNRGRRGNISKMLMAWHCQRPNISYNEKKLFDEYYKTLFHTGYDPSSTLALQT